MIMKKILPILLLALFLSSCDNSGKVYLEQKEGYGLEWRRVALIYGYSDNYHVCTEHYAKAFSLRIPDFNYRCIPTTNLIINIDY
jgi:hypothetical protein